MARVGLTPLSLQVFAGWVKGDLVRLELMSIRSGTGVTYVLGFDEVEVNEDDLEG